MFQVEVKINYETKIFYVQNKKATATITLHG